MRGPVFLVGIVLACATTARTAFRRALGWNGFQTTPNSRFCPETQMMGIAGNRARWTQSSGFCRLTYNFRRILCCILVRVHISYTM